jgi:antitoxin component YwqK of YwqJK toxin-antitoxin module
MSESDWSYINDKWGHDSDGMPNFMNDSDFYGGRINKPIKKINENWTEKEFYESGVLKSEKKYHLSRIKSSSKYFENGNTEEFTSYSYFEGSNNLKKFETYYENGNKSFQMNNTVSGDYSTFNWWYENGRLEKRLDCFHRLESNYNENGMLTSEGRFSTEDYEDFKKEGKWTFCFTDEENELFLNEYTQYYKNDKREGEFCGYDLHRRLRETGNYKDDEMHGKWLQFDEKLNIVKDYFYKNGKLIVRNPQYE